MYGLTSCTDTEFIYLQYQLDPRCGRGVIVVSYSTGAERKDSARMPLPLPVPLHQCASASLFASPSPSFFSAQVSTLSAHLAGRNETHGDMAHRHKAGQALPTEAIGVLLRRRSEYRSGGWKWYSTMQYRTELHSLPLHHDVERSTLCPWQYRRPM